MPDANGSSLFESSLDLGLLQWLLANVSAVAAFIGLLITFFPRVQPCKLWSREVWVRNPSHQAAVRPRLIMGAAGGARWPVEWHQHGCLTQEALCHPDTSSASPPPHTHTHWSPDLQQHQSTSHTGAWVFARTHRHTPVTDSVRILYHRCPADV